MRSLLNADTESAWALLHQPEFCDLPPSRLHPKSALTRYLSLYTVHVLSDGSLPVNV
jgi:hypothetical protein